MTYAELKIKVAEMVANGEPLHGMARDIAIELALEELERAN
jgi:hypothetical protein